MKTPDNSSTQRIAKKAFRMDRNFDVDEIEENIEHSSEDEKVSIKSSLSQTLGRTIGNKKDKS